MVQRAFPLGGGYRGVMTANERAPSPWEVVIEASSQ